MKKLVSLVLALAMVLMCFTAFADDGTGTDAGTNTDTGTGTDAGTDAGTDTGTDTGTAAASTLPVGSITITNLENGDAVSVYKIVEWNTTNSDWNLLVTLPEAYDTVAELVTALNGTGATAAATALAAAVANATAVDTATVGENGTYTSGQEVGMYLALVATNSANIYNPMVLSVNFTNPTTAANGSIDADTAVTGATSVAKKQPITLDKDVAGVDKKSDIAVGDIISYTVSTVTPNYGANYTNPYFVLTVTLSTGLEMTENQQGAISVMSGENTLSAKENNEDAEYDYEITTSASGYTITFSEKYLHTVKAETSVTVTYSATVTKNANFHQVDEFENEVTAEFSNKPTGTHGSLTDDTHHYTFSIDASLLGQSSGDDITKELKKISMDEDGNIITAWETTSENSWTSQTALAGATFELRQGDVVRSTTSGVDGRITFTGLDAGTYTLYETAAPAGYKYSTAGIPVEITAQYDTNGLLTEYSIKINDQNTSTYTVTTNETEHISNVTYKTNTTPYTSGIVNTPGVTLPSTGGIGTTIFYILGGLLVVGAAVVLVARRKADN